MHKRVAVILNPNKIKHIHCLGIGGIGVSALAHVLLKRGYRVTGSDLCPNQNTERLQALGAHIRFDHQGKEATQADCVIYSSAIATDNPEYQAAKQANVPLFKRGQILADLMREYYSFAVAGSHGKTTTSAMLAHVFMMAQQDPTFMIGGALRPVSTSSSHWQKSSPARLGMSSYCIGEADESDGSLLFMHPQVIVITNMDADHLNHYGGSFQQLQDSYRQFLLQLPENGMAVLCVDDPITSAALSKWRSDLKNRQVITYGFSKMADYRADRYQVDGLQSLFDVHTPKDGTFSFRLNMPGTHNSLNALATIAVASSMHPQIISYSHLQQALATFPGVDRRLGYHGDIAVNGGYATLIDDYGHHPNEIKATVSTLRQVWPKRRLVMVFQPHRYSRTRDLMAEFADVLIEADVLLLLDIYSASEAPIEGISTEVLRDAIIKKSIQKTERSPIFVPSLSELPHYLHQVAQAQDIIVLQGAGTVGDAVTLLTQNSG